PKAAAADENRSLRLKDRRAADDRANDLNVLDLVRAHGMRIVGQQNEIRQLARGDGALEGFLARGVGAVDRIDLDRLVHTDALIGAPRRSIPSGARYHALDP